MLKGICLISPVGFKGNRFHYRTYFLYIFSGVEKPNGGVPCLLFDPQIPAADSSNAPRATRGFKVLERSQLGAPSEALGGWWGGVGRGGVEWGAVGSGGEGRWVDGRLGGVGWGGAKG